MGTESKRRWPLIEQIPLEDESVKWGKGLRDCQRHYMEQIPKFLLFKLFPFCSTLLSLPLLRINLLGTHLGSQIQGTDLGSLSSYNSPSAFIL